MSARVAGLRRDPLVRVLWLARPLRGRLILAVLASALATSCGIALLATSGFLLARASQHPNILAIAIAVVAVRGLSVGRGVFRYAERLASHDAAFRILVDIRVRAFQRMERLAPAGLRTLRPGDLLARLVSDVDATQDLFLRGVAPPAAAVLAGAGAVIACLLILPPAGAALVAGLLAAGTLVPWLAAARARRTGQRLAPARGEFTACFTDLLSGAADLHAFGAQEAAAARAADTGTKLATMEHRAASGMGLGTGLSSAAAGLTVWAVLGLAVAATGAGALTRVPLAVVTLTALAAFEAVTALPAAAIQLGQARASATRLTAVIDAPDPVRDPAAPLPLPTGPIRVRLRGAQVRYEPGGPLALDGVDLDLAVGRRVALIGPSGAGKSTVAAVLLRFCELSGGSATLGGAVGSGLAEQGEALSAYAADDVRTVIGGCAQDPHIFDTTIAGNLRLARPSATQEQLASAAGRAGLLPWITSLPLGWDTPVGAHGTAISGGQRQRLALARALLADPPLMILDEPTAHLDPDSRRALTTDILTVTQGRATLLITHDLDGLDQVDEIVLLDHGRVAARGTHAELLRAGGLYRQMWQSSHPHG
ncbi:MAG TPA: thiol reductant ABC exporter subunit CydC [Streptosporangiaceae bacterium]|nr:thiol reductant ABC exporter subunit CydC [Streptosporangiaceae bacterium]